MHDSAFTPPLLLDNGLHSSGTNTTASNDGITTIAIGEPSKQHLIFIDNSIENYQALLEGSTYDARTVLFDSAFGISQISAEIATYASHSLDSLHIVSHGDTGQLQLGEHLINSTNLQTYQDELIGWSQYLSDDADILFYGCNVGEGNLGQTFIQTISTLTDADVAASTDITGNQVAGGNWQLERTTGAIETELPFSQAALQSFDTALLSTEPLFLTLKANQSLNGISVSKGDIVQLDGADFSQFFDGSDLGVNELSAFDIISDTETLMSFRTSTILDGIGTVSNNDIVKFTASSLGADTAGTFDLHFSGETAGLSAGIDGLTQIDDGSLLISTNKRSNIAGIGSTRDEDIVKFTPTTLGDNSSGAWSMYVDGSKVNLKSYAENIDAFSINTSGDLLLSTQGNFDVSAVTGKNEDIFVYSPSSPTSGTYQPDLFFDGSSVGLASNSISGFDLALTPSSPTNTAPVALDDTAVTNEEIAVSIDVLNNDSDLEEDTIVLESFNQPTGGSVTLDDNGSPTDATDDQLIHTPNQGFTGEDSFSYTISDGAETATANVLVTVNTTNTAPIAVADSFVVEANSSAVFDVAANDLDDDGNLDPTSVVVTEEASNGGLVNNGDGTLSYTPNQDFVGTDTFSYTISDTDNLPATGTVTIEVNLSNTAPIALDDEFSTAEDVAVDINVSANDSDSDGPLDLSSVEVLEAPDHGMLVYNGDGTFGYTPSPDFYGSDSFTYQISDTLGLSDQADVELTVNPVNDSPVATDDTISTEADTSVTFNPMENDTDTDGDSLTLENIEIDAATFNGVLTDNGAGSLTYIPNPGFTGADTFTYTVNDGQGGTDSATVTVTTSDPGSGVSRTQLTASPDILVNDGFGPQPWGDGVSISAFDWDGESAAIAFDDQFEDFGFGVQGGRYDQIDFISNSDGISERIELDFGGTVSDVVITLGQLSPSERLKDETGKWTAYDNSGNIVATGLLEAELSVLGPDVKVEGSLKAYPIALTSTEPFSKVVIEATGFDHGTSNPYIITNPNGIVARRSYLGTPFEENSDFNIMDISYVRES